MEDRQNRIALGPQQEGASVRTPPVEWDRFGKLKGDDDQPDLQRNVSTSYIFRSGNSAFAVIGEDGYINAGAFGDTGMYVDDMRIVSRLTFLVNGQQPRLRYIGRDQLISKFVFRFVLASLEGHIDYTIGGNAIFARLRIINTDPVPAVVVVHFAFAADHYDTFYVRFPPSLKRGVLYSTENDEDGLCIQYDSIDGRTMRSFFRTSEKAEQTLDGGIQLSKNVSSQEEWDMFIQGGLSHQVPTRALWRQARGAIETERLRPFYDSASIETENPRLRLWLRQSGADFAALTATLDTGLYPYAGLPWFGLPFGRDGLIAGFQTLEINPSIMKGVLLFQAKHQAITVDPYHQAAPGKIMHEMRLGETSRAGLNPFDRYYGSVDTTLLFAIAVHAYWRRTGCDATVEKLWPSVDLALRWITDYGDLDGDGFVEYEFDPGMGLTNQGWKDSWDAIMHADGMLAKGSIALCEVQGYAYAAWRAGEAIAAHLGFRERATFCGAAAEKLYRNFNRTFWQDDLQLYALALDGAKKPCRVRTSNMAHLPWCGIVPKDRGQLVMKELLIRAAVLGLGHPHSGRK